MTHKLDTLKGETNYRGCLVKKIIGGYQIFGQNVKTANEIDEIINIAYEIIKKSIKQPK